MTSVFNWTQDNVFPQSFLMNFENISIGIGKTIVEFFSEEMVARVCRYIPELESSRGLGDDV